MSTNLTHLFLSFRGRINRKPFWLASLALYLVLGGVAFLYFWGTGKLGFLIGEASVSWSWLDVVVLWLVLLLFLYMALALSVKRLHDRNKSWLWLAPFWFIPTALESASDHVPEGGTTWIILIVTSLGLSLWALVELGFLKGTPGRNEYGEDPLA